MVVVDDAHASTLALAATTPAQLADATRTFQNVAGLRMRDQIIDQITPLILTQEFVLLRAPIINVGPRDS